MNWFEPALRGAPDHRQASPSLARDRRQRLRVRVGDRWACGGGSGPGRWASSATCCCSLSSSARPSTHSPSTDRCSGRPAARSSSSSPASTAGGAGTRSQGRQARRGSDAPAITPRWATVRERFASSSRSGCAGAWSSSGCSRCIGAGLAAAAVVLLVRRLDLRRVDRRDLRDGPRLERLLAGLDRGRPRGRPARCWHSHFYPSAVLYAVYGGLVIYGFFVWLKASREERDPEPRAGARSSGMIGLATIEDALAALRARPPGARHRQRGPRERGRRHPGRPDPHRRVAGLDDPPHQRLPLRPDDGRDRRPARPAADGGRQPRPAAHRLHGDASTRPRASRPASARPTGPAPSGCWPTRSSTPDVVRPARTRDPAAGQGRRRARAPRPHRGGGRPLPPRRPGAGRRDRRAGQRRRHDDAAARGARDRCGQRRAGHHHRAADRLAPAPRPGRDRSPRPRCPPGTASSRPSASATG